MVYSFMHGGRVDVAPKLEEFFRENKIHRVVVGHKPVGEHGLCGVACACKVRAT